MHKRPEYPDDGNADPFWFTIARDKILKKIVGACRACNNVQRNEREIIDLMFKDRRDAAQQPDKEKK